MVSNCGILIFYYKFGDFSIANEVGCQGMNYKEVNSSE